MANASNYTDATDIDFKGGNYNIDIGKSLSAEGMRNALHTKEKVTNKTDAIDSSNSSSDTQYPSVKAVSDSLNAKDNGALHKAGAETITGVKTFGTVDAAAEPLLGVAKTTDATDSGTKFATEAQVYKKQDKVTVVQQSALDSGITASKVSAYDSYFTNLSFFPKGTILTFSRAAWDAKDSTFRAVWAVCDGASGSGTPNLVGKFLRGADYPAGETGGADSVSLVKENLPKHAHTITDPGHCHSIKLNYNENIDEDCPAMAQEVHIGTATTEYSETGIMVNDTFPSQTSYATPFSILPMYYTVIYIMKIS